MRNWIKRYDPEFERHRKVAGSHHYSKTTTIEEQQVEQTQLQVESEWYPPEQTPNQAIELVPDSQAEKMSQLMKEIDFLKQQVSYWMQQEPVSL